MKIVCKLLIYWVKNGCFIRQTGLKYEPNTRDAMKKMGSQSWVNSSFLSKYFLPQFIKIAIFA
jgi:hypothetical protein